MMTLNLATGAQPALPTALGEGLERLFCMLSNGVRVGGQAYDGKS